MKILHGLILLCVFFSVIACASTKYFRMGQYDRICTSIMPIHHARGSSPNTSGFYSTVRSQREGSYLQGFTANTATCFTKAGPMMKRFNFFKRTRQMAGVTMLMTKMIRNCKAKMNVDQDSKDGEPPKNDKS